MTQANKTISNQVAIEKIKQIHEDFLNKLNKVESKRDDEIRKIIDQIDQRQLKEVQESLKKY